MIVCVYEESVIEAKGGVGKGTYWLVSRRGEWGGVVVIVGVVDTLLLESRVGGDHIRRLPPIYFLLIYLVLVQHTHVFLIQLIQFFIVWRYYVR